MNASVAMLAITMALNPPSQSNPGEGPVPVEYIQVAAASEPTTNTNALPPVPQAPTLQTLSSRPVHRQTNLALVPFHLQMNMWDSTGGFYSVRLTPSQLTAYTLQFSTNSGQWFTGVVFDGVASNCWVYPSNQWMRVRARKN